MSEIKENCPEILVSFKQDWYQILDELKSTVENWSYKEIKKYNFSENDIQSTLAGFLKIIESMLNKNGIRFRFEKESVVFNNGRIDFIFRFTEPYKEAAVEIKPIKKTSKLDNYGINQLLDYMKRREIKEGIRLIFNYTNDKKESFERKYDNEQYKIIHYFIDLNQTSSSSLN